MNLTGYGAESSTMGGADAALSRDSFAANLNPAGLAQITGKAFDVYLTTYKSKNAHADSFGTFRKPVENDVLYGAYSGMGYAQRLADTKITVAAALVVQGGSGWAYRDLPTAFGTRDELSALFGVSKLALAAGWQASDRLNLGIGLGINRASGEQSFFPGTSVFNKFYGLRLKDVSGYGFNAKLGLQYKLAEDVTLGINYGTRTNLPLKGGSLRVNYTADPAIGAVVRYDDAQLRGLVLPQEVAVGVAFRPIKPLLVVVQDKWYDWSDAIQTIRLVARTPRNNAAPPVVSISSPLNFNDQHVISIGLAYDYDEKTLLRAGINYAHRPIPDQNLSPIFALIPTTHVAFGFERKLNPEWSLGVGLEHHVRKSVTYTNPNAPFGANATEQNGGNILHVMVSRRWG